MGPDNYISDLFFEQAKTSFNEICLTALNIYVNKINSLMVPRSRCEGDHRQLFVTAF